MDPTELLNITSTAPTSVKENVASNDDASSRGDAAIIYKATAQLSTPNKAVEWRLEGSDANSFGIDDNGNIWFRVSPDYESAKKSYSFDLVAMAATEQLIDRQTVTINIEDVDETPSEMRLGKSYKQFFDDMDTSSGKKLAVIKFVIRQGDKALELWLKPGAELLVSEYEVVIEPIVTGAGDPPDALTFTLEIISRPLKDNSSDDQMPDDGLLDPSLDLESNTYSQPAEFI